MESEKNRIPRFGFGRRLAVSGGAMLAAMFVSPPAQAQEGFSVSFTDEQRELQLSIPRPFSTPREQSPEYWDTPDRDPRADIEAVPLYQRIARASQEITGPTRMLSIRELRDFELFGDKESPFNDAGDEYSPMENMSGTVSARRAMLRFRTRF